MTTVVYCVKFVISYRLNQPTNGGGASLSLSRALVTLEEETHRKPNVIRARLQAEPSAGSSLRPARARSLYKKFHKFLFGNTRG